MGLYVITSFIFGATIGGMIIRKLLLTATKYKFITFNFAIATPITKISTILILGLAVLGVTGVVMLIASVFDK